MSLDFEQYLTLIRSEAASFDRHLASLGQPDQTVVGCPGWTVAELRDHTAGVFAFWLSQVAEGDPTAAKPTFPPEARARANEPVTELAAELTEILHQAGPSAPCWNWSGVDQVTSWVARRLANEVSVHGADAAATAGSEVALPLELAADGIDELVEVFLDAPPAARIPDAPLLRLTTPDRTWDVAVSEDGVWINGDGAGREPDTTVRGSASDLILRLWGRPSTAEVSGDSAVLARWQALRDS